MESDFTQLKNQVEQLQRQLDELRGEYYKDNYASKIVYRKDVEMLGTFTQATVNPTTSFGLGVTPAVRQSSIAAPVGGVTIDSESRNAINSILNVLDTFGLTL